MALVEASDVDEEDRGRSSDAGDFCWMRAINPATLSLEDGVGCM